VTDSIIFPGVRIGAGARVHRCIVDKNVVVPEWTRLGLEPEEDMQRFTVSDEGIVVLPKDYRFT
jgi:glucose-1-phosphate adenylyltransferase